MNRVQLFGSIKGEPKYRTFDGGAVLSALVATTHEWTTRDGQAKSRSTSHRIAIFGNLATQDLQDELAPGTRVLVEGRLSNRSFEGRDGVKQWMTEVVVDTIQVVDAPQGSPQGNGGSRGASPTDGGFDGSDDEIPF